MPLSPLFLLLTHTPYRGLSALERAQLVESVRATDFDPQERDGEITLLDRFLQKTLSLSSTRDSVFVHDILSSLLDKGVPSELSPATTSRFLGRLPLARALLENHRQPAPDESLPAQLRLANALLDEVYVSRPSGEALAGIDAVLARHGPHPQVFGLPAVLWLAMQSGPTNSGSTHPSGGWAFSGSASEASAHGARVFRGLHKRLEATKDVLPAHRWLMNAWALSWAADTSGPDQVKAAYSVLGSSGFGDENLRDIEAASHLAERFDPALKARTAAAFVRAAPVLASPLGKGGPLGDEGANQAQRLASGLVHHGLSLAWQESAWTLENDVLGKVLSLSTKDTKGVIRHLASSSVGMTLALRLWVATGLGSSLNILPGYRQEWLNQVIRAGQSAPKRLLGALDEVGPVFDEALEKDAWASKTIPPLLAQVRALRLSAVIPEEGPACHRPRSRM